MALKPIIRFNENLSNYQNVSVDLSVKRKFEKGWSVNLLSRTWFIPDRDMRQFIWFDVDLKRKVSKYLWENRLRMHWALDVNSNPDSDYLRWRSKWYFSRVKAFRIYLSLEPWFRLNGINAFKRMRYEPGFNWKFDAHYDLDFHFRIEDFINRENKFTFRVFVINLRYNF